jgi:hypothetical protein
MAKETEWAKIILFLILMAFIAGVIIGYGGR